MHFALRCICKRSFELKFCVKKVEKKRHRNENTDYGELSDLTRRSKHLKWKGSQ